jgi:hypothetical protein
MPSAYILLEGKPKALFDLQAQLILLIIALKVLFSAAFGISLIGLMFSSSSSVPR